MCKSRVPHVFECNISDLKTTGEPPRTCQFDGNMKNSVTYFLQQHRAWLWWQGTFMWQYWWTGKMSTLTLPSLVEKFGTKMKHPSNSSYVVGQQHRKNLTQVMWRHQKYLISQSLFHQVCAWESLEWVTKVLVSEINLVCYKERDWSGNLNVFFLYICRHHLADITPIITLVAPGFP